MQYGRAFFVALLLSHSVIPLMGKETVLAPSSVKTTIPNVPVFSIDYKGEHLKCYPIKYTKKTFYERLVEYRCLKSDIKISDTEKVAELLDAEATGQDETARMVEEIKSKEDIGNIYTVNIPERLSKTPWKARNYAYRQLKKGFFHRYLSWLLPAKLYISVRPQYSSSNDESTMKFRDGGSRGGFFYYYAFDNGLKLTLQHEAKINWGNFSSFVNVSSNSKSTRRLQYINLGKKNISLLVGKYWSPYYDIAGFTDKFMAYGPDASGTYNDMGDGGASGTGRSNKSAQIFIDKIGDFSTRLQLQAAHHANEGVNTDYDYGGAGNIIYRGWEHFRIGASIAYGKFDEITPEMRSIGIDGNELSYIAGISYSRERLSINGIVSYSRNHMNDDEGIYFDGVGAELYARYDITESVRFSLGGNWLNPRDSDYEGKYGLKRTIFSLQYTFGRKSYDDLVYVEVSIPKGHLANGDPLSPSVAVGLRYLFNIW